MTDDDIAAALAEIRERPADVPRLLTAVEAALELAARWQSFGDGEDAQSECAAELRAAITTAWCGSDG